MSDDFKGSGKVTLKPLDQNIVIDYQFPVKETLRAVEGNLPYGESITSTNVKIYSIDNSNSDVTSEVLQSSSVSGEYVYLTMSYPTTTGNGRYKATFEIFTTTSGQVHERDFLRIEAVED